MGSLKLSQVADVSPCRAGGREMKGEDMMKPLALLLAMTVTAYAADPVAAINGISRDDVSGCITVSYVLTGADAIVTFGGDSSSSAGNWKRLANSAFRCVQGDVNRLVAADAGATRMIM